MIVIILLFIILRGRFETTYFDLKIKAVIIEDNVIFLKSPNPHLGVFFPFCTSLSSVLAEDQSINVALMHKYQLSMLPQTVFVL